MGTRVAESEGRRSPSPRSGWAGQFRVTAECGDDHLLDAEALSPTDWDESEWEWQSETAELGNRPVKA